MGRRRSVDYGSWRMSAEETIKRAAARLAEEAGPQAQVILFGSHARGDARPGSDLDFLVIESLAAPSP